MHERGRTEDESENGVDSYCLLLVGDSTETTVAPTARPSRLPSVTPTLAPSAPTTTPTVSGILSWS